MPAPNDPFTTTGDDDRDSDTATPRPKMVQSCITPQPLTPSNNELSRWRATPTKRLKTVTPNLESSSQKATSAFPLFRAQTVSSKKPQANLSQFFGRPERTTSSPARQLQLPPSFFVQRVIQKPAMDPPEPDNVTPLPDSFVYRSPPNQGTYKRAHSPTDDGRGRKRSNIALGGITDSPQDAQPAQDTIDRPDPVRLVGYVEQAPNRPTLLGTAVAAVTPTSVDERTINLPQRTVERPLIQETTKTMVEEHQDSLSRTVESGALVSPVGIQPIDGVDTSVCRSPVFPSRTASASGDQQLQPSPANDDRGDDIIDITDGVRPSSTFTQNMLVPHHLPTCHTLVEDNRSRYRFDRCRLHGDPDCDEPDCTYDFFTEFSYYECVLDIEEAYIYLRRMIASSAHDIIVPVHELRHQAPHRSPLQNAAKDVPEGAHSLFLAGRYDSPAGTRPYLSGPYRRALQNVDLSEPELQSLRGRYIHVGFSAAEAEIVRQCFGAKRLHSMSVLEEIKLHATRMVGSDREEAISRVTGLLRASGRTARDVTHFIDDCCLYSSKKPVVSLYIRAPLTGNKIFKPTASMKKPQHARLMANLGMGEYGPRGLNNMNETIRQRIIDGMQPWKVCRDGCSDIIDICWSPDGVRFGLSCIAPKDEYNRPGNLILGNIENSSAKMVHGHKTPRKNSAQHGALDPDLHRTVTSVKFSADGRLLYSGGHDKTVKIWHGHEGVLLNTIPVSGKVIHMAVNRINSHTIAAACKYGKVHVARLDDYGFQLTEPSVFDPPKENLQASTVMWCHTMKPNWLLAAYDNMDKRNSKAGGLAMFDVVAQKPACKISPASTRHFDLALAPRGDFFAAACTADRPAKHAKSYVRIFNFYSDLGRPRKDLEFDSPQKDINKVTISPCGLYVTASGTDGTTNVWDCRNPDEILCNLPHGDTLRFKDGIEGFSLEDDDTGVNFASWGPTNDRFYSGGSDGVVKVWDIKRGGADVFISDMLKVTSEIMSAQFSPDFDMLMVGEASGTATLLGTMGGEDLPVQIIKTDRGERHPVDEEDEDCGDEARQAAHELLTSGRFIIEDGFVYEL